MTRTALAALALLAGTSLASAADFSAPAYDWTGFYAGLQAGYLWSDSTSTDMLNNGAGPLHAKGELDPDGIFGGLHAGYNIQQNQLVYGFETDLNLGDINGRDNALTFAGGVRPPTWDHKSDMGLFGSARVRLGFAADRFMPYITAGLAAADYDVRLNHNGDISRHDEVLMGWTLGAGMQYAVTDDMSLRLEYRYSDYGSINDRFDNFPTEVVKADLQTHAVQMGLSWKF